MNLDFTIENQRLTQNTVKKDIVNDTQNYLTLSFSFNNSWDDFTKYVIFHANDKNYCLEIENNSVIVPSVVLKDDSFVISVFGNKDNVRLTTNKFRIDMVQSGYTENFVPIGHDDVDAFTDIYEKIEEIHEDYIAKSDTVGLVKNDGSIDTNQYLTEHQDLSDYVKKSNTVGLIKNDGTIDTNHYLTEHQDLSDYLQKSSTAGLVKNDGSIDTNKYLTEHQDISNYVQKSNTKGLIKNDGSIDTNKYLTEHQDLSNYIEKSNTNGLIKNDGSIDTNQYLTEHQSLEDYYTKEEINQMFEDFRAESTWMVMQGNRTELDRKNRNLELNAINVVNGVHSNEDTTIYFFKEEEEEE